MKLTNLSKILIVVVIMVALFFVFKQCIPMDNKGTVDNTTENNIEQSADVSATQSASNAASASFDYVPKNPVNGKLKGVVELGASGFNSFIINIDEMKNWKLERAEWGNSLVYDGLASGKDISTGLKKYISDMLDFGVPGKQIHFVVSSGAKTVPETQSIIQALKDMGYVVNTVSPEQEAQYALKSVLPKEYKDKAFVVDIGSGNTKISWMNGDNIVGKESMGAKYYTRDISDQEAYDHAYKVAQMVPKSKANSCFIIGGVPFSLAKMDRNGKERFTVLKSHDQYEADGAKMKSGLNLYKAISEGTGCKTYVFDWDANFTIGFLLSL